MSEASSVCWKKAKPELWALTGETRSRSGRKSNSAREEDTATNILPSGNSVLTQLTLCLRTAQLTDVFCLLLTRRAPKRKDFSDHTLSLLHYQRKCYLPKWGGGIQPYKTATGWVLKEPIHSIEQCRLCMYKTEAYFLISYTCQAKYLVLTHGVFDIYLQSWGDLQFTSAITMYDSSAVSTGLKNKSDWNHHLIS